MFPLGPFGFSFQINGRSMPSNGTDALRLCKVLHVYNGIWVY